MEDRILAYLNRRAARPEHLEGELGLSASDLRPLLDDMQRKGWVQFSAAWYGNDPAAGITVISLTPVGRQEAQRLEAIAEAPEPVVLTRQELADELRRLGWTEQQIAMEPSLRGDRFHFWRTISAWSMLPE